MSAPTDPSAGERKRERIHSQNLSGFRETMSGLRQGSEPGSRGNSGNGDFLISLLLYGAVFYVSDSIREQYFPGGDPIQRNFVISLILIFLTLFAGWILRPFFRTRTFKALLALTLLAAMYWYLSGS